MPTLEKVVTTPCLLNIMVQLCDDTGFIISSKVLLPADSFTHVSETWGSVSWLDHIVSSSDFHNCIKTVSMSISLCDIPGTSSCNGGRYRMVALNIVLFRTSQIKVPDGVYCTNVNCIDPSHITDTNSFFNEITQCLIHASDTAFFKT